jgi:hypothetical protein
LVDAKTKEKEKSKMKKDLTPEQIEEQVEIIREAQDQIVEGLEAMQTANITLGDSHAQEYLINQLKTLITSNHGFLCRDYNIDEWIEDLETEAAGRAGALDEDPIEDLDDRK